MIATSTSETPYGKIGNWAEETKIIASLPENLTIYGNFNNLKL
jgi:hypothetical protein